MTYKLTLKDIFINKCFEFSNLLTTIFITGIINISIFVHNLKTIFDFQLYIQ
jgi:hypothetical protein